MSASVQTRIWSVRGTSLKPLALKVAGESVVWLDKKTESKRGVKKSTHDTHARNEGGRGEA